MTTPARPGRPFPLGATWDGSSVNFSLFSEHATAVDLCLFDGPGATSESQRIPLPECTGRVWHGSVPGLRPGRLYGYRVHGPYEPENGHRFNPAKVLLDPYAKAIGRKLRWHDALFGYRIGAKEEDLSRDERDSAAYAPLAAVTDAAFDWGDDAPPRRPWHRTLIYEMHVKGFTKLHPEVPLPLRGTYAGLGSPAAIRHLTELGVTAVELLPVHHHIDDRHLLDRGLSNYWGYNTLAYFAPELQYAAASDPMEALREFKAMVKALHAAGLEVILDVVYNHTCEGNHMGPTLSFRGIDNASYYRAVADQKRYLMDTTGCGNSLNMPHPNVLQLVMDSLRYWVLEMHVDGFRFDLATTLARAKHGIDTRGAFFDIIHQDPVLSQVKLIAEPWDVGDDGYQVGKFPTGWVEWNGKYRDSVRRFWKGEGGATADFATRLSGSSDLYAHSGRRPYASVNFVTAHDGFTLADLVSYNQKHNEANGDNNTDGTDDNASWNCGAEGPTPDPAIRALRNRQQRNLMATLLLSQGVPMICGGDEMGRTQHGNNNTYCQDSELSWLAWKLDDDQRALLVFTRRVIRLWRDQPALQRRRFFHGRPIRGSGVKDILWLDPSGAEMSDEAWNSPHVSVLGVRLAGETGDVDEKGRPVVGDSLLLLLNGSASDVAFALPAGEAWELMIDTSEVESKARNVAGGERYPLKGRSVAVLKLKRAASNP